MRAEEDGKAKETERMERMSGKITVNRIWKGKK